MSYRPQCGIPGPVRFEPDRSSFHGLPHEHRCVAKVCASIASSASGLSQSSAPELPRTIWAGTHSHLLDQDVVLKIDNDLIRGRVTGFQKNGELILRNGQGDMQSFHDGEVLEVRDVTCH